MLGKNERKRFQFHLLFLIHQNCLKLKDKGAISVKDVRLDRRRKERRKEFINVSKKQQIHC